MTISDRRTRFCELRISPGRAEFISFDETLQASSEEIIPAAPQLAQRFVCGGFSSLQVRASGGLKMTEKQAGLYDRIMKFEFDRGGSVFPFSARLARENGWSRAYTARVITEYRRFVFLAFAAGHPVSPSDQVDQAWHLHLLYTRSYWQEFCGETLGMPFHHQPTEGGAEERVKFAEWYAQTLESYRAFFDQKPPEDIWPGAGIRFGQDIRFERVNRARSWIVRKPWVRGGGHD
jgi:hypothetical protein